MRAMEQGLAEVGCTAEIVTVVKEYPDGRLDLVTEGRKRFELLRRKSGAFVPAGRSSYDRR